MNLKDLKIDTGWTLFLDRDGVINRRIVGGYVRSWDQFEFLPGVEEAIRLFSGIFGRIIVVSNQQGIGKGLMTGSEVESLHLRMTGELEAAGGKIDAIFFSPHLHAHHSILRKPNIGMALKARKQFPGMSFNRSVMAGDSFSDLVFGKRAGMKTVFISTDPAIARKYPRLTDFIYPDLLSMARALFAAG